MSIQFPRDAWTTARRDGLSAGIRSLARGTWHAWKRFYHDGEAVHWLKWYLRRQNPTLSARCYTAEMPAKTFSQFHLADVFEERYLVHEFLRFVRAEDTFWDVGGKVGLWTLLVAQAADHTVVFEPDGRVYPYLREAVEYNDLDAEVTNIGLSDYSHSTALQVNDRWGLAPIYATLRPGHELIDDGMRPPDVMKIDVEGAELAVLKGMADYLADVRYLVVEVHPGMMDADPDAVADYLSETHEVGVINERGGEYHLEAWRREGGDA